MIYNAFVATIVHTPDPNPTAAPQPAPRDHGPQSNQDAAALRQQARTTHFQLFLHNNITTNTPSDQYLPNLQSIARMKYFISNHPDLPLTHPDNSTSSDNDDDDIPPFVKISDDSASEDHNQPSNTATLTDDEGRQATQRTIPTQATRRDTYDIRVATQHNRTTPGSEKGLRLRNRRTTTAKFYLLPAHTFTVYISTTRGPFRRTDPRLDLQPTTVVHLQTAPSNPPTSRIRSRHCSTSAQSTLTLGPPQ